MRLKMPPGQWPEDPALLSKPAPIKGFHGFKLLRFSLFSGAGLLPPAISSFPRSKLRRLAGVSGSGAPGTRDFRVTGWRSGSPLPKSRAQRGIVAARYFFFSAFQMVLEMALPQNGQKLMG